MLQFYSASTSIVNSRRAITECLEVALEGEPTLDCDLIIIYTAMGHNFKELLSEAHQLSPNAQVVGCTCAGIIGTEGPNESLRALAVMVIKGPKDEFVVSGIDDLPYGFDTTVSIDLRDAYSQLSLELKNRNPGINMIFCHPAQTSMNRIIIEGIESVFGQDIPIAGGVSVDNMKFVGNFQFIGEQVFEKGAIMIGFADPTLELISLGNHGFDIIGKPFEVTHSEDMHVIELDGRPPWKSWTEKLGMPETSTMAEVLIFAPLAVELPVELHEEYGSPYLVFGGMPLPDGTIYASRTIPEGTKLWLTKRNEKKILEGVDRMMIQILERCEGRKPVAVFHADCAARGKMLFNRIMKDEIVSRLQYPLCKDEKIPWLGMYGGGELTPLGGRNELQGYTSSLYVIVKRKQKITEKKIQLKTEKIKSSTLFESTTINNITLKNRFVGSSTWMGKANPDGSCSPMLISSLVRLAKGNVGMIVTGMVGVSKNAQSAPLQLGVYSDDFLPGLRQMAESVHRAGSPIIMQLEHGGLFAVPLLTGQEPSGPSVLQTPDGLLGREMTKEEIKDTINAFKDAAVRAQNAGFDGVQVHAGHGWLLSQFLSPFFNRREDEYGGSIENRARIVLEIVNHIRETTGTQFLILIKINSQDNLPGGFGIEEMVQVSEMLENAGVDAIEISGGTIAALLTGDINNSFSPATITPVYYREAAKRFKETIKIPLILVGGIRSFETADDLVKTGIADYVSLCRPLIREPGLIKRWKSGDLRKSECTSSSACFQPGMEGKGVHCVHIKNE
ncbi:MAG: FIST N-terminal domain-containing protein [Bacteroides sp.]|nr:FIST N-terminal domain-containing protein [Bacteroides sp.]